MVNYDFENFKNATLVKQGLEIIKITVLKVSWDKSKIKAESLITSLPKGATVATEYNDIEPGSSIRP